MIRMFSYNKGTEAFNDIIEEAVCFAAAQLENKSIENKEERLKNLNFSAIQYAAENTRVAEIVEKEGLNAVKNPRVYKCTEFLENYNVILAETINSVLPMVASRDFSEYFAEIRQVGWGETAQFVIKSNELYKVNEIAEGVNRGVLQHIYDNMVTVNTKKTEVAASVDWYPVAAGIFDLGEFGLRYAKSYEAYLFLKVIAALTAGISGLGQAYNATGFSDSNWITLAQRVSAANGGAAVYAIGTLTALSNVLPAQVGLQYGLGQEIAKDGFLKNYKGVSIIPVDQIFTPDGAVNTTGAFALPDDKIFFVAADTYKPVKVVFEGTSSVVERDPDYTPDRTYRIRIQERVGVAAIVGSKSAMMTL